jgi:hypothetical protein
VFHRIVIPLLRRLNLRHLRLHNDPGLDQDITLELALHNHRNTVWPRRVIAKRRMVIAA